MTCSLPPLKTTSSFWDSTPIGRSIHLRLNQYEEVSPQLIIEDKVIRSAVRLQNRSQLYFIGTLISDDESQRLTYVIDRLLSIDSITNGLDNHQLLTGEFLVPIQCENKDSSPVNTMIQTAMKEIDTYCRSSLPIELHRYSYLCGQMHLQNSSCLNVDLSFDLLTINNSFTLTPIHPDCVQILPTALLKNLSSSTGNNTYKNQAHFGYCSLDRMSKNKILLILENDPQACTLPVVGIWISGIADIQCPFVWTACIRYCWNLSLKQRLCSGGQAFLLACYLSTSRGQCTFYEVSLTTSNSTPPLTIDYDLWTCSKTISNVSSHQYDTTCDTQFPYDFDFKRVHDESKLRALLGIHLENISIPTMKDTRPPRDMPALAAEMPSDDFQAILSSPNTNGSLFGFPRLPPKQSTHQSPSWDFISTTPMTTPKRPAPSLSCSPKPKQFASPTSSVNVPDNRWKEELIERMQSYETHIQSLTALVSQLLTTQKQQSSLSTPIKECPKRDVAVQSEPSSPYVNNRIDQSLPIGNSKQRRSLSPTIEQCQQQSALITTVDRLSTAQFQPPLPLLIPQQEEPLIDYSSVRSISPPSPSVSPDLNPVDILKPIFQYINNQQQKQQQQQESTVSSQTTNPPLLQTTDEGTEHPLHSDHAIQQQHVTSTRTTGISFISHGVQMQFINQQSSTTTVYPQTQSSLPSNELLPTSPQRSENNLSIEVHSLEMKYLEDEQLAAAIEYDRQTPTTLSTTPQTPHIVDKSLSFETQEYLRRYGLFPDPNK